MRKLWGLSGCAAVAASSFLACTDEDATFPGLVPDSSEATGAAGSYTFDSNTGGSAGETSGGAGGSAGETGGSAGQNGGGSAGQNSGGTSGTGPDPECTSNANCSAEQVCIDSTCGSCSASSQCDSNEVCRPDTDVCVTGNCLSNTDCTAEQACVSFTCGNCASTAECDSNEVCRPDTDVCVVGNCLANSDCTAEQACVSFTCGNCASSADCDGNEVCRPDTDVCVVGDCLSNSDCSAEQACVNFTCGNCASSADCDGNEVCRPDTDVCVVGDCLSNSDCTAEQACVSFTCGNCSVSADCDSNEICLTGTNLCAVGECQAAPDCTGGLCDTSLQCMDLTTTQFASSPAVAVPTGPAVVTATLAVSGVDPFLWDLNVTTFIPHTFAADIDLTLTSPVGTVVTLTTDNGAGNDNVFNGTVWDDSANPAGQVPYTTNTGLATDNAYVNLTLASPLAPEEPLGAFFGEDPNGTWTLTLSDDLAGDGGSIDQFNLSVTTAPLTPTIDTETYTSADTAVPIADAAVTTSTVAVPADSSGAKVCKITVLTNISHAFAADIDMTLMSPTGTIVTLTTDNGAGNDDVFAGTVWDDEAAPANQTPYVTASGQVSDHPYVNLTAATPLAPEEGLSAFRGEAAEGTWTLTISDDLATNTGTLNGWSVTIDRCFF